MCGSDEGGCGVGDRTWLEEAEQYFRKGYEAQMRGDLEAAIGHYRRSIELCPTAEAHTFLGWAHSHQGKYEEAIRECKIAIQIEPNYVAGRREFHRLLGMLN